MVIITCQIYNPLISVNKKIDKSYKFRGNVNKWKIMKINFLENLIFITVSKFLKG